jgi:hypothetical protein
MCYSREAVGLSKRAMRVVEVRLERPLELSN